MCYEIIYTDNVNYTYKNEYKFCIGNEHILSAKLYEYTKDRKINIENDYQLLWDIYNNEERGTHCFLKNEL